jgi:hypothetical protein
MPGALWKSALAHAFLGQDQLIDFRKTNSGNFIYKLHNTDEEINSAKI